MLEAETRFLRPLPGGVNYNPNGFYYFLGDGHTVLNPYLLQGKPDREGQTRRVACSGTAAGV